MANSGSMKVRGVTIEIGGDVSGLSKALGDVNSSINKTQKELKDVEKLLKLDPSNTELLRQKHELLGKQVEQTKTKLETLKKTEEELNKAGVDKHSDQYRTLQREIISTEDSLRKLEAAAAASNVTLTKVSQTFGKISDASGKVAQATKGLSTAAGGALAGIAGLAIKSAAAAAAPAARASPLPHVAFPPSSARSPHAARVRPSRLRQGGAPLPRPPSRSFRPNEPAAPKAHDNRRGSRRPSPGRPRRDRASEDALRG